MKFNRFENISLKIKFMLYPLLQAPLKGVYTFYLTLQNFYYFIPASLGDPYG